MDIYINPENNKKRYGRMENLDALKALCITMVVFCHFVLLSQKTFIGNVAMSLAWGAVPCFMMVSGALLHNSSHFLWKKYLLKISRLAGVLAAWRLIYLLITMSLTPFKVSTLVVIQYLFLLKDIEQVRTGVMWYIIAYIMVLLLYPVTYFLFHNYGGRKVLAFVLLLAGTSGILIPSIDWVISVIAGAYGKEILEINSINRIMPFQNYANMLFYFILGGFLFYYRDSIKEKTTKRQYITIIAIAAGTIGLLLIKYADCGTWRWNNQYIRDGYTHISTLLLSCGLFLFFLLYNLEKIYHAMAICIGRYTMGIYYLHYIILFSCSVSIYPQLTDYYSFSLNVAKTIIVLTISVFLTIIIGKIPYIKKLVT